MSRARKLILILTAVPVLLGALAVFTPATAAPQDPNPDWGRCTPPCDAPCCDLDCRHNCPFSKKVKGVGVCIFMGCETDGECMYGSCSPQ